KPSWRCWNAPTPNCSPSSPAASSRTIRSGPMSSPSSSLRGIDVAGRRSEHLLVWLGLVAVMLGLLVMFAGAPSSVTLAWYVLWCLSSVGFGVLGLRSAGVLGPQRILRMGVLDNGDWSLSDRQGTTAMRLLPGTRIGRGWVWLRWAPLQSRTTWL